MLRSGALVALAVLLVAGAGCSLPVTTSPTTSTATDPASGDGVRVTVERVVDGDTARVVFANGTGDTVRFVGVDAPETRAANAPGEFEGVPDTEAGRDCLRAAGANASAYVASRIEGRQVTLAFDPALDRRGYYDRLLAYVVVDGESINRDLVRLGHARVYDSPFVERERYEAAERDARGAGRGLWSCATGG